MHITCTASGCNLKVAGIQVKSEGGIDSLQQSRMYVGLKKMLTKCPSVVVSPHATRIGEVNKNEQDNN